LEGYLNCWFIGYYIAEYELRGAGRAKYGDWLLGELANHQHLARESEDPGGVSVADLFPEITDFEEYWTFGRLDGVWKLKELALITLPPFSTHSTLNYYYFAGGSSFTPPGFCHERRLS